MENREHRLAAIMYTDIKDFSRMMEEDEVATLQLLDYHNDVIKKKITEHRGTLIKTIGDAVLAHFPTAMDAVQASIGVQMEFSQYNLTHLDKPLLVRIGVHLGDIYFTSDDAFGEGINIAARLQSISRPGRVCLSREVFNQVDGKMGVKSRDLGRVDLKNITRIINAHELIIPSPPGTEDEEDEQPEQVKKETSQPEAERTRREARGERFEARRAARERLINSWSAWDKATGGTSWEGERQGGRRHLHSDDSAQEDRERIKAFFMDKVNRVGSSLQGKSYQAPRDESRDPYEAYRNWRLRFERSYEKAESSLRGHLISYLTVNGFLLFLNMVTSAGFPWFLFPAGGWGIGIASHWANFMCLKKDKKALDQLPQLDEDQLALFKRIRANERNFFTSMVSTGAVSLFLIMINVITGANFPWALIPVGAMGFGFLGSLASFKSRKKKYLARFKDLLSRHRGPAAPKPETAPEPDSSIFSSGNEGILGEVKALHQSIKGQLKSFDANPLGDDAKDVLDNYVNQIFDLHKKNQEMEEMLSALPLDGMEEDVTRLREKMAATESTALRSEYENSIQSIERQRKSVGSLREQKEILELRMNSAVNSMKQMNIDLARMKNLTDKNDISAQGDNLKRRTRELSQYIEDFNASYEELEWDNS